MNFKTLKTPDGTKFRVAIISKEEADRLERKYENQKVENETNFSKRHPAYYIDNSEILYRQFYKDFGYLFPTLTDYNIAKKGETYYDCSIYVADENTLIVCFGLMPAKADSFRQLIKKEITDYEPIDGDINRKFFLLNDETVILIKKRTEKLSDGYWFSSMRDFDYCYYIFAGKKNPQNR